MVSFSPNLQKLYLISLFYLQTHISQCLIHTSVYYRSSIFRRKHQVVYQYRDIVAPMKIFAHTSILRRKRRGIVPQEIEVGVSSAALGRARTQIGRSIRGDRPRSRWGLSRQSHLRDVSNDNHCWHPRTARRGSAASWARSSARRRPKEICGSAPRIHCSTGTVGGTIHPGRSGVDIALDVQEYSYPRG